MQITVLIPGPFIIKSKASFSQVFNITTPFMLFLDYLVLSHLKNGKEQNLKTMKYRNLSQK